MRRVRGRRRGSRPPEVRGHLARATPWQRERAPDVHEGPFPFCRGSSLERRRPRLRTAFLSSPPRVAWPTRFAGRAHERVGQRRGPEWPRRRHPVRAHGRMRLAGSRSVNRFAARLSASGSPAGASSADNAGDSLVPYRSATFRPRRVALYEGLKCLRLSSLAARRRPREGAPRRAPGSDMVPRRRCRREWSAVAGRHAPVHRDDRELRQRRR